MLFLFTFAGFLKSAMRMTILPNSDVKFQGIAGLADHQIGKLVFFDQKFDCDLINSETKEHEITISTKGVWYAKSWQIPSAYSQKLIADVSHTWILERKNVPATFVIVTHICETFSYRKNYAPTDVKPDFHLTLK
jgi:hypothetical protein